MRGRAGRTVFSSYPCSGRATAAPAACERGVAPGSPSGRRVTRQPCDRPGDQVSATVLIGEAGEPDGYFDVHNYIAMCREHYEKVGIGAAYVDTLFR